MALDMQDFSAKIFSLHLCLGVQQPSLWVAAAQFLLHISSACSMTSDARVRGLSWLVGVATRALLGWCMAFFLSMLLLLASEVNIILVLLLHLGLIGLLGFAYSTWYLPPCFGCIIPYYWMIFDLILGFPCCHWCCQPWWLSSIYLKLKI